MDSIEFSIHGPMTCVQSEATKRKYHMFVGKSGRRWLVADQDNAADDIYVEGGKNSQGFGGAVLTFTLVDGSCLRLKGPWKTGAGGLFTDTGHDVRTKYLTQGIVAFEKVYGKIYGPDTYSSIVHFDESPVLGEFGRTDKLAQQTATLTGRKVWFAMRSKGGGCAHFKRPEDETTILGVWRAIW